MVIVEFLPLLVLTITAVVLAPLVVPAAAGGGDGGPPAGARLRWTA